MLIHSLFRINHLFFILNCLPFPQADVFLPLLPPVLNGWVFLHNPNDPLEKEEDGLTQSLRSVHELVRGYLLKFEITSNQFNVGRSEG